MIDDRTKRLLWSSALAVAAACAPACDDDDRIDGQGDGGATSSGGSDGSGGDTETGGTNGSGGSTSSGGTSSGGSTSSGGTSSGGSTSSGGTSSGGSNSGGQGTGGTELDASVDGSTDAGADASADASDGGGGPAFPSIVLASATNYGSSTVISTVDLVQGKVLGETIFADGDTISVASDGKAFAVERRNGFVNLLTSAGAVSKRISLHPSGSGNAFLNPQNVVVVPGTSRAYVPLLQTNTIAVLDLEAGALAELKDFSVLTTTPDTDGSADLTGGVYDPRRNRVYFVAQRIDLNSGTSTTGYASVCRPDPSLLFAVDATTGATIDLNGSADGFAVPLQLAGPTSFTLDAATDRLVLLAPGCAATSASPTRAKHGVETVDLATNQTTVRYASPNDDYLGGLLLLEPNRALVQTLGAVSHHFDYAFGPALGAELPGVPANAQVALPDALVGLRMVTGEAGAPVPDVVRYDVTTHQVTSLLEFSWSVPLSFGIAVTVVK